MIYVHRDLSKIPNEKLERLKALSEELDKIGSADDRKAFIKANAGAWSDVRAELSAMSFGKCWYTESREAVSRYQTDHFRPHGRVKQTEKEFASGYCWLAFDIKNFRIVGVLANTLNQEHSVETIGKGIWFPLADPSTRATLQNRNLGKETPLLLDPIELEDTKKIEFNDNGEAHPAAHLDHEEKASVDLAITRMGIRQDMLNQVRRKKWRECARTIDKYDRFIRKPKGERTDEEVQTIEELAKELITISSADSEFASTVRCCLQSRKLDMFINRSEIFPLKLE